VAKLVVRAGRSAGAEHLIPPEKARVVLGRSFDSDIQVLDTQASRTHAEITGERGRFTLRDLKSSNGTRLNGRLVEDEAALKFGDKIGIGGTIYQFVPEADEMTGEGLGEETAPAAPSAFRRPSPR
jgi:pSer/pThr/pTyr-binding forkhead associated (FHA) protein